MLKRLARVTHRDEHVWLGRTCATTSVAKLMVNRRSLVSGALASRDDAYRSIDETHDYPCPFA